MLSFFALCSILLALAEGQNIPPPVSGYLYTFGGMDMDTMNKRESDRVLTAELTRLPGDDAGQQSADECVNPADRLPRAIGGYGSAYAIVDGKGLVCGGKTFSNPSDKCYSLKADRGWKKEASMSVARMMPAFTLLDESTFWVAGGDMTNRTDTFTFADGWSEYVELPAVRREACLARINDDQFFFGGGVNERGQPTTNFWIFTRSSRSWERVPDVFIVKPAVNRGIIGMSCVAVTAPNGRQKVIVSGGRYAFTSNFRTHIYDVSIKRWSYGKSLAKDRRNPAIIPLSPSASLPGTGFLTVANNETSVFQYTANIYGGFWNDTGADVGERRFFFGALLFPECPTTGEV